MLDYTALIPFMNLGFEKLKIYGDDNQVGVVDFSTTKG